MPGAVGKAGIVFKRNDIEDLAEQISNVLNNPGYEKKIRDAAATHLASFHPKVISGKYLSLMEARLKKTDLYRKITEPLIE